MSNSRSLSVSLNPDGVPDASEPQGDRHAGHRHLAAGRAGRPFRNLPTVAAALAISRLLRAHSVQSRVPWGAGEGAAVLLGSGYRTLCPYLPVSTTSRVPSWLLRKQSSSNPRAFTPPPPSVPTPQPLNLVCFYFCLFLRQSCVAQAGLELLPDAPASTCHVYSLGRRGFAQATSALCLLSPRLIPKLCL